MNFYWCNVQICEYLVLKPAEKNARSPLTNLPACNNERQTRRRIPLRGAPNSAKDGTVRRERRPSVGEAWWNGPVWNYWWNKMRNTHTKRFRWGLRRSRLHWKTHISDYTKSGRLSYFSTFTKYFSSSPCWSSSRLFTSYSKKTNTKGWATV